MRKIRYRTSLKIPHNGIYSVHHKEHHLPEHVTLLEGEEFPRCSRCDKPVWFEFIMGVGDLNLSPFRVVLHQIPVIEESKAAAASTDEKAS